MRKRLKIGIPAWSVGENSFGAGKAYLDFIKKYGDPVLLCPMEGILEEVGMILLPGGRDAYAGNYGQVPGYYTSEPDPFKEYFVKQNLDQYIKRGVPVWATCLGMQQLAIHFGGHLNQHIKNHPYSDPRDEVVHIMEFQGEYVGWEEMLIKRYKLRFAKNDERGIWTNSLHHQAVPVEGVPDCFDIVAKVGKVVEAIIHKELPIAGGQFHTEEDHNALGTYMFETLVEVALNNQNDRNNKDIEKPVGGNVGTT